MVDFEKNRDLRLWIMENTGGPAAGGLTVRDVFACTAMGALLSRTDSPKHADEEYYMKLNQFHLLKKPISASEIKGVTGVNHRFMSTMFGVDADNGKKLYKEVLDR